MMNDGHLWATEDAPVTDVEEWATLMALAARCDPDGCNAFQSYATIAERAHIDPKTVYRRCKAMEARGLIKRGNQMAAALIPADRRPVVWDLQIPYSWFPNVDRVNRWRAEHGRPPLTPQDRPDLAPAPARKRRADAGTSRRKKSAPDGRTSSPPATGLVVPPSDSGETGVTTGLVVPPDSQSPRDWTTSPTTPLGVTHSSKEDVVATSPPTPSPAEPAGHERGETQEREEKKTDFPGTQDKEWRDFWPDLTGWEQQLMEECLATRPDWSASTLRKTLGWHTIRERASRNPELVRRAFLLGAADRGRGGRTAGTATPRRLLADYCPLWARAADQIQTEQQATTEPPPAAPDPSPVAVVETNPAGRAPAPIPAPPPATSGGGKATALAIAAAAKQAAPRLREGTRKSAVPTARGRRPAEPVDQPPGGPGQQPDLVSAAT